MEKLNLSSFPVLETERLILRKLESSDDKLIFEYKSNKENFKFVDMEVYTDIKEAKKYIRKMNEGVDSNQWLIWAIENKSSSQIIGTISIWNISYVESKAELGFGLFQGSKGQGYMTEALKRVIDYGLNNLKIKNLEAYTNKMNSKSRALLEKNSFVKIKSFTETNTLCGIDMEMIVYKYFEE